MRIGTFASNPLSIFHTQVSSCQIIPNHFRWLSLSLSPLLLLSFSLSFSLDGLIQAVCQLDSSLSCQNVKPLSLLSWKKLHPMIIISSRKKEKKKKKKERKRHGHQIHIFMAAFSHTEKTMRRRDEEKEKKRKREKKVHQGDVSRNKRGWDSQRRQRWWWS